MRRDYQKLAIEDFGRQLLLAGDLDPLYIALHKAELPHDQLCRWLVSYWCLYHAGVASWLSKLPDDEFWDGLQAAAANEVKSPLGDRWPRGAERRHWRGQQAIRSADELTTRFVSPSDLIAFLTEGDCVRPRPYAHIRNRALELRGFGDWIAFKIGDMLDVLEIEPITFDRSEVFMFSEPRKGALMCYREKIGAPPEAKIKDEEAAIVQVVEHLTKAFSDLTAPPSHQRPIGLQEVETVLCKWKSHMNGHYPVGKDIIEISEGLDPWTKVSTTAATLRSCMPPKFSL